MITDTEIRLKGLKILAKYLAMLKLNGLLPLSKENDLITQSGVKA